MDIRNKKILIMGLGLTGLSTLSAIKKYTRDILVFDEEDPLIIKEKLKSRDSLDVRILNLKDLKKLKEINLIVKSPGIKPDHPLLKSAEDFFIPIISDIELGYFLLTTPNIIGITGTNGKTTASLLAGQVFKAWGKKTFVTGNVGLGLLDKIEEIKKDDILIIELSSFQLYNTYSFKTKSSLILNISPDHLDWHKTMDNYIEAKFKIFKNQGIDDYLILNYDDLILRNIKDRVKSQIIWFSTREVLDEGVYIEDEHIVYKKGDLKVNVIPLKSIKLLGNHNLENICGVIGLGLSFGIDIRTIKDAIEAFKGVPHRLEFVCEYKGVKYYNDSKGTNIDSSIKAIEALEGPITLIAGGYDKGSKYDKLLDIYKDKEEALILLGQTKNLIKQAAKEKGLKSIYLVDDMKEAVKKASEVSKPGSKVLLSPACASWDMYKSFEERGDHFKDLVFDLRKGL